MDEEQEPAAKPTPESKKPVEAGREAPQQSEAPRYLENDPKLAKIEQEFESQFPEDKRLDETGIYSGEYQDHRLGNPAAEPGTPERRSLEERARVEFAKRHPEDAARYAENERPRLYERPEDDPAIKAVDDKIQAEVAEAVVLARNGGWGTEEAARVTNGDVSRLRSVATVHAWRDFIDNFPEKSNAYRAKLAPIDRALEGKAYREQHARQREFTRQQQEVREKTLVDDPTFTSFMAGLNDRVWEGVPRERSLTGDEYTAKAATIREEMVREFVAQHPEIVAKYGARPVEAATVETGKANGEAQTEVAQSDAAEWLTKEDTKSLLIEYERDQEDDEDSRAANLPAAEQTRSGDAAVETSDGSLGERSGKAQAEAAKLQLVREQLGVLPQKEIHQLTQAERIWGTFEHLNKPASFMLEASREMSPQVLTVRKDGEQLAFVDESTKERWHYDKDGTLWRRNAKELTREANPKEQVEFASLMKRLFQHPEIRGRQESHGKAA